MSACPPPSNDDACRGVLELETTTSSVRALDATGERVAGPSLTKMKRVTRSWRQGESINVWWENNSMATCNEESAPRAVDRIDIDLLVQQQPGQGKTAGASVLISTGAAYFLLEKRMGKCTLEAKRGGRVWWRLGGDRDSGERWASTVP